MMNLVLTVVYLIQSAIIVRSSLPISDPDNPSAVPAYNLIDTKPSCFDQGICPMFPPGGQWSVFPNAEEKYQHLLFNLHRMFANHSLNIDIGMYSWYDNNGTSLSYFYDGPGSNCGTSSIERKPLYWYSDANQAARFLAWDRLTCNSLLSDQDHDTCQKGLDIEPIWGSGSVHSVAKDRCSYFGDCLYSGRANAFCHDQNNDDCWFYTESICDGNQCLEDAQCDPIFQRSMSRDPAIPRTTYVGTGFVEGNDFNSAVFSPFTIGISYPLPIGMSFDIRQPYVV